MSALSGETEYVGGTYNPVTKKFGPYGSYVGTTYNSIIDIEVEYKFIHIIKNVLELSYGVGLGYRSWRRELSKTQVEVYSWSSIRPKIGLAYTKGRFYIGSRLEYQSGINPKMTILKNLENPDTTVNLGSANILQFSIPIKFSVAKRVDLVAEYTYQNQSIK